MIRFTPLLLVLIYGIVMYRFSVWRTHRELDDKSTELADPVLKVHLTELARALDLPKIKVNIYEIEPVNGLAAPDGRIFITRGFYDKYAKGEVTGEELTSVIAHELGHVALGHSRRRMIDFAGQNAIRTALIMIMPGFLRAIGPWLANMASTMLAARLSRGDEYEADAYATALLMKAGIGAGPQMSLFHKLDKLSGGKAASAPAWLLSHPHTKDRVAAIQKNEAKWLKNS